MMCVHCNQEVDHQGKFDERGSTAGPLVLSAEPYDIVADVCRANVTWDAVKQQGLPQHEVR